MKSLTLIPFVCVALASSVQAQDVKVFFNNQPFKGKVSGSPADLQLEAGPVLERLGRKAEIAEGTEKIQIDEDKSVPVSNVSGVFMVRAKDVVSAFGGKYDYNKSIGSVDIYAYDPVAAAKKSLATVLKLRKIHNDSDFQVCSVLTRQILVQQLGLTLDTPAQIAMCTPAEMARAGAGGEVSCYVTFSGQRKGDGTANYKFFVRQDQSPGTMIADLAWSWGITWANHKGFVKSEKYSIGFAYWASYKVVSELTRSASERSLLEQAKRHHPAAVDGFRELREIDKSGGVEAVVKFMKEKGNG